MSSMVGRAEVEIKCIVIMRVVMRIIGQVTARIISTAENNVRILCAFVAVPDYRVTRRNNIAVYRI